MHCVSDVFTAVVVSLLKLPKLLLQKNKAHGVIVQMACFKPEKVLSKPQFPFLDL